MVGFPVIPISETGVFLFVVVVGYVASAIAKNGVRLLVKQVVSGLEESRWSWLEAATLVYLMIAGPSLLFDTALREGAARGWPQSYLWAALAVVFIWSFVLGLFVLSVLLTVG